MWMWKASASCERAGSPMASRRCLRPRTPFVHGASVCCMPSRATDADGVGVGEDFWLSATAVPAMATATTITPATPQRDALLASTGHNYWAAAVAVALVLGLASALAVIVRQFRGGLRGERTMGADGVPRLAGHLAALQVSIFLLQEVLERLDVGAPL